MRKNNVFHLNIHFTVPLTLPPGAAAPRPPYLPQATTILYFREDNVRVLDTDYNRQQAMLIRNAVMVTNIHKILVSFRVC
jgi:hypothetical protein